MRNLCGTGVNPTVDAKCRIDMLGELRVRQAGQEITRFRTRKSAALLAYLAYHLDRGHPREVLTELLWPWSPPAAGRANLRAELAALRRQLEPPGIPQGAVLLADRFSVQLNPRAVCTDVSEFADALSGAGAAQTDTQRIQCLEAAVDLYRGLLLPGYYEDWVIAEQRELGDRYDHAITSLAGLLEKAGQLEPALSYARRAASIDPLRESSHRLVMRLLVASGDPAAALRQYRDLERALHEELGETPSEPMHRWAERLLSLDVPVVPVPKRRPDGPRRHALTVPGPTPTGTVTFLVTEVARSAPSSEAEGGTSGRARESLPDLLHRLFRQHGGYETCETSGAATAVFAYARDALDCAVAGQQAIRARLGAEPALPSGARMALYTGEVRPGEERPSGAVLGRASRLVSAAHEGQILCAEATCALLRRHPDLGVALKDLGSYRLGKSVGFERVFQVEYPGMEPVDFPPLRAEAGYGATLPLTFTSFFGREEELAQLHGTVVGAGARLVTLTGPGGSGKTRLALEAARQLLGTFRGAVWFVPLCDLRDAEGVPSAIAAALKLPCGPDSAPLGPVLAFLSHQPSLLVLDNMEQVLEGAAPVVQDLLERAPTLQCIVTSRQRLGLEAEMELRVGPLPIPVADEEPVRLLNCSAVQLFVDRAQAARPDFQLTARNVPAVAELCRRLEGLPLALELAAAWSPVLTPAQMATELAHRFSFLVSRRRGVDERHRTLRAAVDWSYQLLSRGLRDFASLLSVFRGGWTADAAASVCERPDALEALLELHERSIVYCEERAGQMRYRMSESFREFAAELVDTTVAPALRARHAEHFLEFAQSRAAHADGPNEAGSFAEIEADLGNLRAAMDWARSASNAPLVLGLSAALCDLLWRRGYWQDHEEWTRWGMEAAECLPPANRATAARLLHSRARVRYDRGDLDAAERDCRQGLAAATEGQDRYWQAMQLNLLGLVCSKRREHEESEQLLQRGLDLFRAVRHQQGEGMALHNLGVLAYARRQADQARAFYEEGLPIRQAAGDLRGVAETQNNLGILSEEAGQTAAAEKAYSEALRSVLALGDVLWMAVALCNLGELALRAGGFEEAARLLGPAEHALRHLGSVHAAHAASCLQEALAGAPEALPAGQSGWRQALLAAAREAVGPARP